MNRYERALKAAGAKVKEFKTFGEGEGEWWAIVEWGWKRWWIMGTFGACQICDPYLAEFGHKAEHRDDFEKLIKEYGRHWLDNPRNLYTPQDALSRFTTFLDVDPLAEEKFDYVTEMTKKYFPI